LRKSARKNDCEKNPYLIQYSHGEANPAKPKNEFYGGKKQ
jgi:hypothetical protein